MPAPVHPSRRAFLGIRKHASPTAPVAAVTDEKTTITRRDFTRAAASLAALLAADPAEIGREILAAMPAPTAMGAAQLPSLEALLGKMHQAFYGELFERCLFSDQCHR